MEKKETTFYRFYSEVRAFLSKLISDPIKAEPSKYLKDRDLSKNKLIKELKARDILEMHDYVKDQTDGEEYKKPTYFVTYKVKKKDFEKRMKKIYIKLFEKNVPIKDKEVSKDEEIDEATVCGTSTGQYSTPLFGKPLVQGHLYENEVEVPSVFANEEEQIEKLMKLDPAYKTRGGVGRRKVYMTKEQLQYIQENINCVNAADVELEEATMCGNIGSYTYDAPGLVLKTSDGKKDPSYNR